MKRTYYLFNPGQLERKDNTLKFTPCIDDENGVGHAVAGKPGTLNHTNVELK